jgi:hypothetical protein
MKNRLLSISTAAISSLAMALGAAIPATATVTDQQIATPPGLTAAFAQASAFLSAHHVDEDTQSALFDKFLAGDAWDSFSSESAAVSVRKYVADGHDQTVSHYPDGSVAVTRVEIPVAAKTAFGVRSSPHGCTVGSGGARSNCNVDMWVGLISMAFKANYNLTTNKVTSVGVPVGQSADLASLLYSIWGDRTVVPATLLFPPKCVACPTTQHLTWR